MLSYLLYCRPGFEKECVAEMLSLRSGGYCKSDADSGWVLWSTTEHISARSLPPPNAMVFARQGFVSAAPMDNLPETDRATPLVAALAELLSLHQLPKNFQNVFVETADTNDAKELLPFCKSFSHPLRQVLKKQGFEEGSSALNLHVFFVSYQKAYVGYSWPEQGFSSHPMGIMRLRFPNEAPSRSTLKLEEAFLTFLDEARREKLLRSGMTAVDLGAAPGGWTYQLVRRGLRVTAVDNGPMDAKLMQTGLVEHVRDNGLRYLPSKKTDWMVCDIVESPSKIAELAATWLARGLCRHTIFNLKLPMKKRFEEVSQLLEKMRLKLSEAGLEYEMRCKQLYHDREEVTVFVSVE